MTEEQTQATELQSWWTTIHFAGKEQFLLKDNGELVLKSLPHHKERTVGTITPGNADADLKILTEKFQDGENRVNEVKAGWEEADEKVKLSGKIERAKEYLHHLNAVGDFASLIDRLQDFGKDLQKILDENYQERLKIVQSAEALTDSEDWRETTQKMRELAEQWKQLPNTDKERSDMLWNRLEVAKNKFFERKRLHHEDINKDLLQNLDLKMEIVEKAENLANSENWKEATEAFRNLLEEWKATGRTVQDKNEELWQRFIAAKNVFFDRKKGHFESIQAEQEQNYLLKLALVEKAEELKDQTEWNKTTQAFADLTEEWKNIGRVPNEKSEELWTRLHAAKEHFFQTKRNHFASLRQNQQENYTRKQLLVTRAEELKNSSHWHEATDELNALMAEWKKIGPVPREHSDAIWNQFLQARKTFFERKDTNRDQRKQMAQKRRTQRLQQAADFHKLVKEELKDEEEKLADFRNGLENITPGHKEQELRDHLNKLIAQTEEVIRRKQKKLESVAQELEELKRQEEKTHTKVASETQPPPAVE